MRPRYPTILAAVCLVPAAACGPSDAATEEAASARQAGDALPHVEAGSPVEAGAYLVRVAGCNDCHTAGWLERAGQVPTSEWLKGWSVGFRGPWGTSYPRNLRLTVARMSEDAWVQYLGSVELKPPMPWFNLHHMSERDRRAVYRFIESLGPADDSVPASLAPGQEPTTPYIPFTPRAPGSG